MNRSAEIELTESDREFREIIGRRTGAIVRITRYIDAFQEYERRVEEMNAAMRRLKAALDQMDEYDKEVYRRFTIRCDRAK